MTRVSASPLFTDCFYLTRVSVYVIKTDCVFIKFNIFALHIRVTLKSHADRWKYISTKKLFLDVNGSCLASDCELRHAASCSYFTAISSVSKRRVLYWIIKKSTDRDIWFLCIKLFHSLVTGFFLSKTIITRSPSVWLPSAESVLTLYS